MTETDGRYTRLIIEGIREETKNFKSFFLNASPPISYEAGQFITLIDKQAGSEIRRSYSITSAPALKEPLSIAVKRIDNGYFSRKLIDLAKVGDVLLTTGASGFFRLPQSPAEYEDIFFFAAGSGIAPVLSLIKTVLVRHPSVHVFLIYSNSSLHNTAFKRELNDLEEKYREHLQIHFLFSAEADLKRARLIRDLMLEFLSVRKHEQAKTLFYTCGPENYMRMIVFLLLEEGFPKENIRKEDFHPGNKIKTQRHPPDIRTHMVYLGVRGREYEFPVVYPDSILQAAKKIKIDMPYSCETGKCGSCAGQRISGTVWLSSNEVLTESDLARGLTLTCTGHPQNGDVYLQM